MNHQKSALNLLCCIKRCFSKRKVALGVLVGWALVYVFGLHNNWGNPAFNSQWGQRQTIYDIQNAVRLNTTALSRIKPVHNATNVVVTLHANETLVFNSTNLLASNDTHSPKDSNITSNSTQKKFTEKMNADDMKQVALSANSTWKFNATAADLFRSQLSDECNTSTVFLATKKNMALNSTMQYVMEKRSKLNITEVIHNRFPEEMPLKPLQYKKCSIVGNSGILLDSKCGKAIDGADFVFRFALANTSDYVEDVGSRTDFVTANPTQLIKYYSSLDEKGQVKIQEKVRDNYEKSLVLITPFGYRFSTKYSFKLQDAIQSSNTSVVFLHPDFTRSAIKFWKTRRVKPRIISTGFYIFTAAFSFCEELHLYGFWPFAEDLHGRSLLYHYYNDYVKIPQSHHRMPVEFRELFELHKKGIVHLQMDKC